MCNYPPTYHVIQFLIKLFKAKKKKKKRKKKEIKKERKKKKNLSLKTTHP